MIEVKPFNKIRGRMAEKGYSMRLLSEATDIKLGTLSDKLSAKTEFTASEIMKISAVLDIQDISEYFFN